MTVWVVEETVQHESGTVKAVFSTKEKADAYAARLHPKESYPDYPVTEFQVDVEPQ